MDRGPSKINPPNSHPSNPIHKAAKTEKNPAAQTKHRTPRTKEQTPNEQTESHDINKIAVAVGAAAVVGLMFLSFH